LELKRDEMTDAQTRTWRIALDLGLIALVILATSLFGIATRPIGFLAAFWPANAVLLGMMVRVPRLSHPLGWLTAFVAFVAADLIVGDSLGITVWLSAANIAGALAGYALFRKLPEEHHRLARPISIVFFSGACIVAATAAATVGAGAARLLFGRDLLVGFQFWFTTELVNYVIVLPVLLTAPAISKWSAWRRGFSLSRFMATTNWFPFAALVLSAVASVGIGGPGAFAYPLPALLWCALSYRLFPTAVLTSLLSVWEIIAIAAGLLPFSPGEDQIMGMMSIRLAIALIALGPIAVSSTNEARNELLKQLHGLVSRDSLTGAMARQAFIDETNAILARGATGGGLALLMLDLDNFKRTNDTLGHAAGDCALKSFSAKVFEVLGDKAVFGRLGGEEFAILLDNSDGRHAEEVADRIRIGVESLSIDFEESTALRITVSGGLAIQKAGDCATLESILKRADQALYLAKAAGRNRIVADDGRIVSRPDAPVAGERRGVRKRA
jgi:diguanylate cyclase (GGDEF)-like protein